MATTMTTIETLEILKAAVKNNEVKETFVSEYGFATIGLTDGQVLQLTDVEFYELAQPILNGEVAEEVKVEEVTIIEDTYYTVNIEIDLADETIRVNNNRLFEVHDYTYKMYDGELKGHLGVNRGEVEYIINTQWQMNKTDKFIENLCKKLDKLITKTYFEKGIKLI